MPSGREYHVPKMFITPALDEAAIIRMRAPPDPAEAAFQGDEDDSGDEDEKTAPGAFPGAKGEYAVVTNYY